MGLFPYAALFCCLAERKRRDPARFSRGVPRTPAARRTNTDKEEFDVKKVLAMILAAAMMIPITATAATTPELPLKADNGIEVLPNTYIGLKVDGDVITITAPEEITDAHLANMLKETMGSLGSSGKPVNYRANAGVRFNFNLAGITDAEDWAHGSTANTYGYYSEFEDGRNPFYLGGLDDDFLEYWWPVYNLEVRSDTNDLTSAWTKLMVDYSGGEPAKKSNAKAVEDYYAGSANASGAADPSKHGTTYRFALTDNFTANKDVARTFYLFDNSTTRRAATPAYTLQLRYAPTKVENTASLDHTVPATATVGTPMEFSVTTKGSYTQGGKALNVRGAGGITKDGAAVTAEDAVVEYERDGQWVPLTGEGFGPSGGFPYTSDFTCRFRVTFLKAGEYGFSMSIRDMDGKEVCTTGSQSITVSPKDIPLESITLSKDTLNLKVGNISEALTVAYNPENATVSGAVEWTSNNTDVATVADGKVTAHKAGAATITAKVDGKTATCTVTVSDVERPATGIVLDSGDITLAVGGTRSLNAKVTPEGSTDEVTWSSSNTEVAAVDSNGKVTAVAEGTATITATAGDFSAQCTVTVTKGGNPDPDPGPGPGPAPAPGGDKDEAPSVTDNEANSEKTSEALEETMEAIADPDKDLPASAETVTTASGSSLTVIPVKLTSSSAALSLGTAELLGSGSSKVGLQASIDNGAMTVTIPGGFGRVTEPGRIFYPLGLDTKPQYADVMAAAVKGADAKTETLKAGANMTLPTTATVSLKSKLPEGESVNVYHYNEDTGKYTLLASPKVKDGRITFATRQMGYLLLTTGRI